MSEKNINLREIYVKNKYAEFVVTLCELYRNILALLHNVRHLSTTTLDGSAWSRTNLGRSSSKCRNHNSIHKSKN